ncbi:MAG: TIGR02221 family CRISPR-associated protein [Candidatus Dadabacteria bacterium]|nr:MAG: TIGR02221 family CRISPR-associated protein [Candidatus Dadabacteria bacterium]
MLIPGFGQGGVTVPRTLLSFLGTSSYLECCYNFQGSEVKTRYIQAALAQTVCSSWGPEDRILIFCTKTALESNWNSLTDSNGKTHPGLEDSLKSLDLPVKVEQITVPDGKSTAEIWDIFNCITESVKAGDSLTLDVTHAFRYLPMLLLTATSYARVLKRADVEAIYYGALEALGSPDAVRELPVKERKVPVFDLTEFVTLMDWSQAVDRFITAGDGNSLSEVAKREIKRSKESPSPPPGDIRPHLGKLPEALKNFADVMGTCRGPHIPKSAATLKECISALEHSDSPRVLLPLLSRINAELSQFGKTAIGDFVEAAKWCAKHNLIQQGYTILQEGLISYFLAACGYKHCKYQLSCRQLVNQAAFKIYYNEKDGKKGKVRPPVISNPEEQETYNALVELMQGCKPLVETHVKLGGSRNDLNHAGMNNNPTSAVKIRNNLNRIIKRVEECLISQ